MDGMDGMDGMDSLDGMAFKIIYTGRSLRQSKGRKGAEPDPLSPARFFQQEQYISYNYPKKIERDSCARTLRFFPSTASGTSFRKDFIGLIYIQRFQPQIKIHFLNRYIQRIKKSL